MRAAGGRGQSLGREQADGERDRDGRHLDEEVTQVAEPGADVVAEERGGAAQAQDPDGEHEEATEEEHETRWPAGRDAIPAKVPRAIPARRVPVMSPTSRVAPCWTR